MSKTKKMLKISHHEHTWKLRPHEHTSYGPLAFMLVVVGFALTAFSASAWSATPYDGPEAGSIGITGTMPGKPPTTAATIDSPRNGQRYSSSPVPITGTCPAGTLVEIFKNDIFAGSTVCTQGGSYSIEIDLIIGQNILIARVYDSLNQAGPDSNTVTIFYDALPPQADPLNAFNFGGNQMLLNTDAVFRGIFPDKEMTMPIDIIGGAPPYAVNVQFGDANNKVVPRNDNATFKVSHTYKKPGVFQITIQATDAVGRVAFLTVASIVNGQPDIAAAGTRGTATPNQLLLLWPLYTSSLAIVVSFWLGEQREKKVLSKRGMLLAPHA